MTSRSFRIALFFLLVFVLILAAPACGLFGGEEDTSDSGGDEDVAEASSGDSQDGEEGENDEDEEDRAVPVEVAVLARGPIESVLKSTSTLEAERSVQVFAEAARRVRDLLVEEGDLVRRGDVLIRLQDDEQRNALARVQNELAKSERDYEREQRLFTENLISEEQFNNATYALDQLRIRLQDAERELGYTEVRAPIAGTITLRRVNVGDHVNLGQHLFDIIDFDSLVARIYVPEKHLPNLKAGQKARVSARATGGGDHVGTVDRIAPVVDARSGTVKVTIDVGGRPGLLPGMYVDVDLITATRDDAILVPKRAVIYDNDQMFVFRLVDEQRVERVLLRPKLSDKHNIEPLEGLEEGDRIVVAGQASLKDGTEVRLPGEKEEASAAEGEADDDEDAEVQRAAL